jgi:hypothetical protein
MAASAGRKRGLARFCRQVHALLLKNLSFQRRNSWTNAGIAAFPVLLCVLLVAIQTMVDRELGRPPFQCGCACDLAGLTGACERTECGVQYSTPAQAVSCEVLAPARWPALVQVPTVPAAVRGALTAPCTNVSGLCGPVAVLITGRSRGLSQSRDTYSPPASSE